MTIQRKKKVIQPEEVTKIIEIVENSTSVGDAVKNLLARSLSDLSIIS